MHEKVQEEAFASLIESPVKTAYFRLEDQLQSWKIWSVRKVHLKRLKRLKIKI